MIDEWTSVSTNPKTATIVMILKRRRNNNNHQHPVMTLLFVTILAGISISFSPIYNTLFDSMSHYKQTQQITMTTGSAAIAQKEAESNSNIPSSLTSSSRRASSSLNATTTSTSTSSNIFPSTKINPIQRQVKPIYKKQRTDPTQPQFYVTRTGGNSTTNTTTTIKQTIPKSMMLLDSKLLWCPNAKAGTTSMYESILLPMKLMGPKFQYNNTFAGDGELRCYEDCPISAHLLFDSRSSKKQQPQQKISGTMTTTTTRRGQIMNAPSFTIVRNPWDRLRSCYKSKIVTQKLMPNDHNPHGRGPTINNLSEDRQRELQSKTPIMSFVEFVHHVETYPNANPHWQPHSTRCLTVPTPVENGEDKEEFIQFQYDYTIKLEDGLFSQIKELFDMYDVPFPNMDVDRIKVRGVRTNKTQADYDHDQSLIKFYSDAVNKANSERASTTSTTLKELVDKVGRIYYDDVRLYNYSFPPI